MSRGNKAKTNDRAETAGRLAVISVPMELADESLGHVRDRLTHQRYEVLDVVVVLGPDRKYLGAADLRDVLSGDATAPLRSVMRPDWPRVSPTTDQEHAAEAATAAGVATVPVVAADGWLVGCLPAATLLSVLAREHREDLHRLTGILAEAAGARHALEDPPLKRVASRLPWLLVGLALSAAAAAVMAGYERALQANVMIAFFIPSLVYLTDAIGTQTEAIAVRGLSVRKRPLPGILLNETMTGSLIGLVLGTLALLGIWAAYADLRLAFGVGV